MKLRVGSNSTFELELWAADYITNVTEVRVAATVEDLQNAPWSPYSETANSTYTWTLPLVFAQFKSAVGKESEVVSDTVEAVTYETIQASFNVNPSICAATTLSIDNSSLPLCEQCNWRWNFGNGTTSQTMEPDFNTDLSLYAGYQTPGFYTIALTATSLANTSTFTQQIEVLPAPSAEFTLERDGRTITVQAENTTAKNWLWDFGDGSTASGTSIATHTYTDTNVLDEYFVPVSLQVEGENGCTNFKFQYVPQEKWLFLPVVMRSG